MLFRNGVDRDRISCLDTRTTKNILEAVENAAASGSLSLVAVVVGWMDGGREEAKLALERF
jgi:cell division inhibitor SulA